MTNNLTYATPESLGIPTGAVLTFLDDLERKRLNMHGFILIRHGKVAAEGYWPPYDGDRLHRMYSVSKSFTAAAIGMMIDEGKLSLSDKVADFFPEYVPVNAHRYVREATVRHLLMMATFNKSTSYNPESEDFVKTFFTDLGPKHKPGAVFNYDTAATTVLCAIVEKLAGKPMLEYMRPVLDEIGFSKDAWCVQSPEGRSWTGSGIQCSARDFARFALLCLGQGAWQGKQLISQDYMRQATSRQIDNSTTGGGPESVHGYGYQFWCMRDGGFGCYGMGSQYALCMPKHDAILITIADTQGVASAGEHIMDAFYRLLEKTQEGPLAEDASGQQALASRIGSLHTLLPKGQRTSPAAETFSGTTYDMEPNQSGILWMRLLAGKEECTLQYQNATGTHELKLGMVDYTPQTFPEVYFGKRIGRKDRQYQCLGAGAWAADNVLLGKIYAVDDYLGALTIQLTFDGDDLCVYMGKAAEWFFDEYQGFLAGTARP